ncbi:MULTISPECIES: LTA synthase family protein [Carnobacterium]|uniref:Sulfatase family protein n=1 Tax=Carnobacterium maltaromaticum LMA28 TaxID=1234679 RepID=K8E2N4_CARML|nr:LTA synthase family protein [Carnobacterium maltaromaticum]AOA01251.1 alkaline phosphatase [Carnobacterium maltaromaticum]MBC9789912.1 sulfatase-like hydrolase/transferase [Carnobacterium maltaromaticum]MBC9809848.1 sulfatase-like hydrolase/transferase [Carnobacterium maltaromaticum]MCI1818380.1 LTA synthase family protein [Carnobacterium maltaromaticum]TFJ76467.1 alkaline phosphatase [Carnobacterium maltaromaticum]
MKLIKKTQAILNTRLGFFTLAVLLFWAKTYYSYQTAFSLGVTGPLQQFILFINPVATTLFIFSIALYFKKPRRAYIALFVLYLLATALLYSNVIYYREFTDFLTVNTMLGAKSVAGGLNTSAFALTSFADIFYILDFIILLGLLLSKQVKMDPRPFKKRYAFAMTVLSVAIFGANLSIAESNRPQLLTRTFDRNYIVKYLGLNVFTVYDGIKTAQANQVKANADSSDMDEVISYLNEHRAAANPATFGSAKGKNVIYIHLESFQQFLIDYKLKDENGVEHEVTPFLNSLYHDQSTTSYENFFHQVGQGKTSDAETLLENSLFGLPQGSAFTQAGSSNVFQAAPQILRDNGNYTSAVFHGNVGSFWNRDNTYKSFGFNYFFDASYYDVSDGNTLEYGLKDKLLFQESTQYLEQLPQPFYAKFLTVTNHFPYPLDDDNVEFPRATTGDSTIDGYFATAHYLDQSVKEFFDYLKASGLYDNSMIVLYGDHYGISNSRNPSLAPLLGKTSEEWTDYDNALVQRVPFMYHIPGQTNGGIKSEFGGQIDVLPTLLHLLGVDTTNEDGFIQFGTDLTSPEHDQTVAFRNGSFVTPKYTVMGTKIYDTKTGALITDPSEEVLAEVEVLRTGVEKQLNLSDSIINSDLLRYYTPANFTPVDPTVFNYKNQVDQLKEAAKKLGDENTSLINQKDGQSTVELYKTDAPELMTDAEKAAKAAADSAAEAAKEDATK